MKSIFHGRETLARLSLFATLGLAIFWSAFTYLSANGHEIRSPNIQLREHIELNAKAPFVYKKYLGPQNVQELMNALDEDYNKSLAKTRVSVSGKFTAKTTKTGKVTSTKTTTYSSDLTLSQIDARYPRTEWLQLLLDKSITIDDSYEYASLLSKRYILALLEDNPDLQQSGFLGIPPTDDWETYKVAYIDKLVNDHTKIQGATEQIERGKQTVERAKAQIEQSKEHVKLTIERSKEAVERANAQLEHAKAQIEQRQKNAKPVIERSQEAVERAKTQIKHSKEQLERAVAQLERSIARLERAQKALSSQQLVHIKKQIEGIPGTLIAPKKPISPQESTPPQGSN